MTDDDRTQYATELYWMIMIAGEILRVTSMVVNLDMSIAVLTADLHGTCFLIVGILGLTLIKNGFLHIGEEHQTELDLHAKDLLIEIELFGVFIIWSVLHFLSGSSLGY